MKKREKKPFDPDVENKEFVKDIVREIRSIRESLAQDLAEYHEDMEILGKITGIMPQDKNRLISDRTSKRHSDHWSLFQLLERRFIKRWEKHLAKREGNKKPPDNKSGG